jgi:hypothetical protein
MGIKPMSKIYKKRLNKLAPLQYMDTPYQGSPPETLVEKN